MSAYLVHSQELVIGYPAVAVLREPFWVIGLRVDRRLMFLRKAFGVAKSNQHGLALKVKRNCTHSRSNRRKIEGVNRASSVNPRDQNERA
jgi:hypothetical protein